MAVFFYVTGCILAASPLIAGLILKIFPPKKINALYGYRTRRAASSQATWDYAQRLCAIVLLWYSLAEWAAIGIFFAAGHTVLRGIEWALLPAGFALALIGVAVAAAVVQKKLKNFTAGGEQQNKLKTDG